jgi:hypothetical protein
MLYYTVIICHITYVGGASTRRRSVSHYFVSTAVLISALHVLYLTVIVSYIVLYHTSPYIISVLYLDQDVLYLQQWEDLTPVPAGSFHSALYCLYLMQMYCTVFNSRRRWRAAS